MLDKIKSFTNRWFDFNKKNTPQIRHEFPLYNITDNVQFGEDPGAIIEEDISENQE